MFICLWIFWWVGTWSQLPWWNWNHLGHLIKNKKHGLLFLPQGSLLVFFLKKKKSSCWRVSYWSSSTTRVLYAWNCYLVLYPARTTIHGQIWVHSSIFVCRVLPQEVVLSVFQLFLSWITISTRKIQKWYLYYESDMKACLGGWTSIRSSIIVDIIVMIKVAKKIQLIFLIRLTPVNQGWATNIYRVKNFVNNSVTTFIILKR